MDNPVENKKTENYQNLERRWEKFYFVKTPWWLKRIYSSFLWSIDTKKKELYLTFDDGPHPVVTPFVLQQLKQYQALATFFCIGKNVLAYPEIYKQILTEGHSVGNHTFNHLNGWKTRDDIYLRDIAAASQYIDSSLFRPCYGRMTSFQAKNLQPVMKGRQPTIVMWDVLSADFDTAVSPENCLAHVVLKSVPGSIIVFHESEKAFLRLAYALPRVLKYFTEKGFTFCSL
ncbi:MAG TPA: polysaccharide deacetylase family protein [Chitinophagaceae bacterium]|nr:polysaccharide deacetylase family protein [Chitinophagaceae bacterium]